MKSKKIFFIALLSVMIMAMSNIYAAGYYKGDVNMDGRITEDDARYILQLYMNMVAQEEQHLALGDMDSNGVLNANDARLILQNVTPSIYRKGDVNCDGQITEEDAYLIVDIKLGNVEEEPVHMELGDMDYNGVLDINDARLIMQIIEPTGYIKGDMNGDGEVNVADSFALLKIAITDENVTYDQIIVGDMSGDAIIRMYDAFALLKALNSTTEEKGGYERYDINLDRAVNMADFEFAVAMYNEEVELDEETGDMQKSAADLDLNSKFTANDLQLLYEMFTNEKYEKGDINRDGKITLDDVNLVLRIVLGAVPKTTFHMMYADMDDNNVLDIEDAKLILKKMNVYTNLFSKGDVTLDGFINSTDAAFVIDFFKKQNAAFKDYDLGDMNEDNMLNSTDAALILDIFKK